LIYFSICLYSMFVRFSSFDAKMGLDMEKSTYHN